MEAVADAGGVGKPVLYTAFSTRGEIEVDALLHREHQRGLEQVRATMPDDLTVLGSNHRLCHDGQGVSCRRHWTIRSAGG